MVVVTPLSSIEAQALLSALLNDDVLGMVDAIDEVVRQARARQRLRSE